MSVAISLPAKTMTAEELMALPEDGIHRELIRGELREKPMTVRNRKHSRVEAKLAKILGNWLDGQPEPRGTAAPAYYGVTTSIVWFFHLP